MCLLKPGSDLPPEGRPARILVVDDDAAGRLVLTRLLQPEGYEVRTAGDGATGIEVAREFRPDIFLLDVRMPGQDGFEVCRELKTIPEFVDVPVIFLTAMDDLENIMAAFDAGGVDFVSKPFHAKEILVRIATHVKLHTEVLKNREYAVILERELKRRTAEEKAGRHVQFRLLPPDDFRSSPYRFQRLLMPSLSLSGDFVDYFDIDDDTLAFYMADVAGHGIASALVTIFLRSHVGFCRDAQRRNASDILCRPEDFLREVNGELLQEAMGKHVSVFYGIIHKGENRLEYANAGQFPHPLLCSGSGDVGALEQKAPPLGLFPNAKYERVVLDLPDEFRLTAFSDGVLEVLPQKRLVDKLAAVERTVQACTSPRELADDLRLAALDSLPDDITILTISRGEHDE